MDMHDDDELIKYNKRSLQRMSTYSCSHDYCPHLHFKKCQLARLKSIPYTIFPDATIDSFTNLAVRSTNPTKSNIPTKAYENYALQEATDNRDVNFSRNYYFNKESPMNEPLCNEIVKDLEEDMQTRSAYVLAGVESAKFRENEKKRKANIENARGRAISRYNDHFKAQNDQKQTDKQENEKWLKKLYRKLEEVAKHIINGEEGDIVDDRQRKFLISKASLTANYLGQIKVRDPKKAFEILEQVRTLMLKKKLRFEQQREQQEHNQSVSMTFTSEASQNTSQNSMISEATSINESRAFGEDHVVGKYCDFQELKKKWGCQDIQEVREMIRRVLTRGIVFDAEVTAVRKRKQAEKNNLNINKKQAYSQPKKPSVNKTKKRSDCSKKTATSLTEEEQKKRIVMVKTSLSGPEEGIKSALQNGGQFDAVGEKFERTRNYSQMFKRREQENLVDFEIKEKVI